MGSCKRKEKFVGLVCLQKPTSLREEARKERLEASDAIAILIRCPQKRRDRAKELRTLALFSESLFFFFFFFCVCARASVCGQTWGLDKAVYGVTLHFDGFLVLRQKPNTLLPYYSEGQCCAGICFRFTTPGSGYLILPSKNLRFHFESMPSKNRLFRF